MSEAVLTEKRGRVLLITMNRPEAMNAINSAVGEGLLAAFQTLDNDNELTAGVVTGEGRGFCSGMDLKAFLTEGPPRGLNEVFVKGARKPLIAAVEGFALAGGLEVALACDLLVAAKGAKLGIPEVGVGLAAVGGALMRLPRRLPYSVAMEMALTAKPITAEQAHEYGLVSRLAEKGKAAEVALELADAIAKNAPLSVAVSKQLIRETAGRTEAEFWEVQKPLSREVFTSDDAKEGPRAFAEKRAPNWSGK